MNSSLRRLSRAATRTLLAFLWILPTWLGAQPTLKILSPADEAVVFSGTTFNVTVEASDPNAFKQVLLGVEQPWSGNKEVLSKPPYRFTVQVPPTLASREYSLTAVGIMPTSHLVYSESISVKVERPDRPTKLKIQPSLLVFDYSGDYGYLRTYGSYADGSTVDLTYSSLTTYVSSSPRVAVADKQGRITATGPGSARIMVTNVGVTTVVPVTVANNRGPGVPKK